MFRRKRPPRRVHGGFLIAFFAGVGTVALCAGLMWLAILLAVYSWWIWRPEPPGSVVLLFFLFPCFTGGFVSGMLLQFDLSDRRMRLLYLAAASPALPIWMVTIILIVIGINVGSEVLAAVAVLCGVSLTGSLLGYVIVNWLRRRGLRVLQDFPLWRPKYPWWNEESASSGAGAGEGTGDQPVDGG